MQNEMIDKLEIRELLENWVIWRDSGMWEKFRSVWHPEGRMMATWTQGTGDEFIEMNKAGWAKGVVILHFLGGTNVLSNGTRAVTQTKMTISQRAIVHGVECDVVCTGRFFDLLEKRDGKWGMILRQPIYEKDRLDAVNPNETVELDREKLLSFPMGYRHLAYIQSAIGYPIEMDMPGLKGERVQELYQIGDEWLEGKPVTWAGNTWT